MNTIDFRRFLPVILRVGFAALLLAWLVRSDRLDLHAITSLQPDGGDWLDLAAGALAVVGGMFLLAIRLRQLLLATGLEVSLLRVLRATYVGNFFGTLLPGLVGGDVAKAAMLCRRIPEGRRRAVGAVMTDRLVGLYSLFLLAAVAVALGIMTGQTRALPTLILVAPWVVVVGVPLSVAIVIWVIDRLRTRIPEPVLQRVEPLLVALRALARSPRVLAGAVVLGAMSHLLSVFAFMMAAAVLGVTLRPLDHLILDPLALALNAIPISPGGLGLAEGGFSWLYENLGSDAGAAVGVMGRAIHYLIFVVGGLFAVASSDRRQQ